MQDFAVYYILANCVSILLFGILLLFDRFNVDRQEKQIKFDRALIAFILYFLTDCFWAALTAGMIPKTRFNMVSNDFLIYLFMTAISYFWLDYVLAVEQIPNRDSARSRFLMILPFLLSTAALILNYLLAPDMLFDEQLDTRPLFGIFLAAVPDLYLILILFYTIRRARNEKNPSEKRSQLFIGLLPLMCLIGGLVQQFWYPYLPIFCSVSNILMMSFYIRSVQDQVSLDPLTGLNNRGQLSRYFAQKGNLRTDDRRTVVAMMDVDRFKAINDTFGHAEGDHALILIADALRKAVSELPVPSFLCRYGGDEFTLVLHPGLQEEPRRLISDFRTALDALLRGAGTPYPLAVSLGYDEFHGNQDSLQACILRADQNLYLDKAERRKEKAEQIAGG